MHILSDVPSFRQQLMGVWRNWAQVPRLIAVAHCEWVRISLSEVRRLNMIIKQATLNRKPRGNAVLLAIVLLFSSWKHEADDSGSTSVCILPGDG
jgi:hypothetical protein